MGASFKEIKRQVFMENIGVINQNLEIIILCLAIVEFFLLAGIIYFFVKIYKINKASKVFFEGKNGKNLEELIAKNTGELKILDGEIQELYNISNKINTLALKSVHKVGILRFNPFNDIGGDQSFSIALLDGKNSGIVISSLHTKEGTRVYSKPVLRGNADKYPLTEEEKTVIRIATQARSQKI